MRREESDVTCTKAMAISDPLGDHPKRFQLHLESQHYSQASIIQYGDCIGRLRNRMRALDIDLKDLDADRAVMLIARPELGSSRRRHNAFVIRKFVTFLAASGATKPEIVVASDETARGRLKRDYEEYLLRQRGLSKRTVVHKWGFANRFLTFCFQGLEGDLSKIAPVDIVRFMQHLISRDRPYRDKTPASHLRSFFLFLFESGRTDTNLAPSVPRIAQQHRATLPRHLIPEELEALLAAVRADSLAEIGDMLRHRSAETTMIYAKLEIDGLRSIALPWPTTGGVQ